MHYKEEKLIQNLVLVSREASHRKTDDGIDIMPWEIFLEKLWSNKWL